MLHPFLLMTSSPKLWLLDLGYRFALYPWNNHHGAGQPAMLQEGPGGKFLWLLTIAGDSLGASASHYWIKVEYRKGSREEVVIIISEGNILCQDRVCLQVEVSKCFAGKKIANLCYYCHHAKIYNDRSFWKWLINQLCKQKGIFYRFGNQIFESRGSRSDKIKTWGRFYTEGNLEMCLSYQNSRFSERCWKFMKRIDYLKLGLYKWNQTHSLTDPMDMNLSKVQDSGRQRSLTCCSLWGHKESDMT